jgi:hypothetical protein
MKLHTIRLGEPWERTELGDGRTRHRRRFGRPRTLDATERLWLACDRPVSAVVNGAQLGTGERFDITDHLQPRNELVIEAASPEPLGTVLLEVWTVPSPS